MFNGVKDFIGRLKLPAFTGMLCIGLVCVSCKNSMKNTGLSENKVENIPFFVEEIEDISLKSILKDKTVLLELNDQSLLGGIKRIREFEDKFFVLDHRVAKGLICFDKFGKFIFKISHFPNSRVFKDEEYYFSDFILDENHKQLEIYDDKNNQILIYDLEGNYMSRFTVPFSFIGFEKLADNIYIFFRGGLSGDRKELDKDVIILNPKDSTTTGFFANHRREFGLSNSGVSVYPINMFLKAEGVVRYTDYFSDTIKSFNESGVVSMKHLNMQNQSPQNKFANYTNEEVVDNRLSDDMRNKNAFKQIIFENEDKMVFTTLFNKEFLLAVINKNSNTTRFCRIISDLDEGMNFKALERSPFPGNESIILPVFDHEKEHKSFLNEDNPTLYFIDPDKI